MKLCSHISRPSFSIQVGLVHKASLVSLDHRVNPDGTVRLEPQAPRDRQEELA